MYYNNLYIFNVCFQMDVRTSDIRVSERVCMSSITIDRFSTVYNDLKDEVGYDYCLKILFKNAYL